MRFKLYTFGCKVNQAESAGLQQCLIAQGHCSVDNPCDADLILVNSCAVTEESVRKTRQLLRSMRRRYPNALLALTGCWPQAFPQDDFCGAAFVTGTKDRSALLNWVAEQERVPPAGTAHAAATHTEIPAYGGTGADAFSALPCADTTKTRAFLKIQDGCNQFCSYCIIPFSRGRCRSMPPERLLREVQALAQQGFREIVLTGINLGFFGVDTGQTLADAVELCAAQPRILRVRLGSLEPERITPALLHRLAQCEKLCPQFHLSLQSGCDAVLARMHRRYTKADYAALVAEIRRLFPDAAITTDIIVGFPGETQAQFEETAAFVREIGFAKVHVFPYSQRSGTRAAALPEQLPQAEKLRRSAELTRLAIAQRRAYLAGYVGQVLAVLIEGEKRQPTQYALQGHTRNGTAVKIFSEKSQKGLRNSVVCVTIETYEDDCCVGRITPAAAASPAS